VGNSSEALAREGRTAPKTASIERTDDLAAVNGGGTSGDGSLPTRFVEVIVVALEGHPRNADSSSEGVEFVERGVADEVTPEAASMGPSTVVHQNHTYTYFTMVGEP
jgi:hypothetical protein